MFALFTTSLLKKKHIPGSVKVTVTVTVLSITSTVTPFREALSW